MCIRDSPYAVKEAGFFLGVLLLVLCGYLTHYSTRLLVNTAKKVKVWNYEELCYAAFGKPGYIAVSFFMISFAFGALVAYFVIIGDTIPKVFSQWGGAGTLLTDRHFIILLTSATIMLPLCLLRDMSALSKTSALSMSCDIGIILIVVVKVMAGVEHYEGDDAQSTACSGHPKEPKEPVWSFSHAAYMEAFGAMCFAFVCHHSSFLVYTSLANPTPKRWLLVTNISIGFAIVASLTLSIAGYVAFENDTKANILSNFAVDDAAINVCRLFLAMTMFFTFPMEFFVVRHAFLSLFMAGKEISNFVHITVTLVWFGVGLIIGLSVTNLGFVLELTGGFSATFLGFILPAACYLRLEPGKIFVKETFKNWDKLQAIFLFVFGCFAMITSTSLTLIKASQEDGC
eukprot:TRINITY_DN10490_c0_g1_i4.p1 TRINITY_DN10490_c0_g1~~TRINITY_DN10490_c0_g1_i4.p1  ORF type:complete len:400 (-),score=89.50 TRINITY_DN10490_c0_g1_i4:227-1426(-)